MSFLFSLSAVAWGDIDPGKSASTVEPKTETRFMGDDFLVKKGSAFYRIRDVIGGSFVVMIDGKVVKIPMKGAPVAMRVEPSLKITEESARVNSLKCERAFTPENDPIVKFNRAIVKSEAEYAGAQFEANDAAFQADVSAFASQGETSGNINSTLSHPVPSNAFVASINMTPIGGNLATQLTETAIVKVTPEDIAKAPADNEDYDAIEVSFEVSSPKPLYSPYVVVLTRFHAKGAKSGYVQNHIWAQSLDPIEGNAKKIHILAGGLPPGYILEDSQVHLYNNGKEIATNVAPQRVELTRDEAFEYLKTEYFSSHKGATLSPSPLMGWLPSDLPHRLARGQYAQTFYVKVSKEGLADSVYMDEACSQPVDDPYLVSVIRDIRFKPALKDGNPVEGVIPLKFSQLTM